MPNSGWNVSVDIRQEFIPTLPVLDSVQLSIAQFSLAPAFPEPGSLVVLIRKGDVNGPIVATSESASFPAFYKGTPVFRFSQPVQLSAGEIFVLQPTVVSGSPNWGFDAFQPFGLGGYSRGRIAIGGVTQDSGQDLLFREGVGLVPEPAPWALLSMAGVGTVLALSKKWQRQFQGMFIGEQGAGPNHEESTQATAPPPSS